MFLFAEARRTETIKVQIKVEKVKKEVREKWEKRPHFGFAHDSELDELGPSALQQKMLRESKFW